jgi:hypothetical protein
MKKERSLIKMLHVEEMRSIKIPRLNGLRISVKYPRKGHQLYQELQDNIRKNKIKSKKRKNS